MKKGPLLLGVLLLVLTVACATTVPISGYTSSAPVEISRPSVSTSNLKLDAKAELKILEARIEPSSPKSEEEIYVILTYEAPAGRELKASINGEVLVSAEMAGPYSRKKTFIRECRGTGTPTEMKVSIGKFHSTRGSLPVRLDIYLEDTNSGGQSETKTITFKIG